MRPASPAAPPCAPARTPGRVPLLLSVGAMLVVVLAGLFWLSLRHRARPGIAPDVAAQLDALNAQKEKLMQQGPPSLSSPSALDPDSLEAQAQRELRRLREKIGTTRPPADGTGDVRLRGGGTLSRETWERARDRVGAPP